jgi:hypothetical protein
MQKQGLDPPFYLQAIHAILLEHFFPKHHQQEIDKLDQNSQQIFSTF